MDKKFKKKICRIKKRSYSKFRRDSNTVGGYFTAIIFSRLLRFTKVLLKKTKNYFNGVRSKMKIHGLLEDPTFVSWTGPDLNFLEPRLMSNFFINSKKWALFHQFWKFLGLNRQKKKLLKRDFEKWTS